MIKYNDFFLNSNFKRVPMKIELMKKIRGDLGINETGSSYLG